MRTITTNATNMKNTLLGVTPINILKIEWSTGTAYYADQPVTLTGLSAEGSILDISILSDQVKSDNVGTISTASVTLDDLSGDLKTLVDTTIIEGTICTIYQYFKGNTVDDLITLLKGRIISDVIWSEGERTLSFDIETYIKDDVVGYAPEEEDLTDINPAAVGKPYPLGFGSPLKVPAVRALKQFTGTLKDGVNNNFNTFYINNGSDFPQGTEISIKIAGVLFSGIFDGDTFTVTEKNKAKYTNISLLNRKSNDPNKSDATVCWIDSDAHLVGLYCYVDHSTYGKMLNRCIDQIGNKCFFIKPWRPNNTTLEVILDSAETIEEAAMCPRTSWDINFIFENISYHPNTYFTKAHASIIGGSVVFMDSWFLTAGEIVRYDADYDDTYVFNLLPSIEVFEVFGYRKEENNNDKVFRPIPSSYYTEHLNDTLGTVTCSYLTFDMPLEERFGEGWDGDVYVSYRSSVGPNGANIIEHLLTTYTNVTPDSSFDTVRPLINNYWANFAVFDQPKAMTLIENIAWQLRCAILVRNETATLKYLSQIPDSDYTITEDDVIFKSLVLGFTSTENLYTRLIADWKKDYSGREDTELTYIYQNNVDSFGLNELKKEITIYNIKDFVTRTLDFWGYRYSNIWRTLSCNVTLKGIELESFDILSTNIGIVSSNTIKGTVVSSSIDTAQGVMSLKVNMSSISGDIESGDSPVEDDNIWTGDPDNPVIYNPGATNPVTGMEQVDYIVPTAGQTNTSTSSDTGTTTTTGSVEPTYYIKITSYPVTIQRGVNFSLTVEIVDSYGVRVNKDVNAVLTITKTDSSDAINTNNISLTNGIWSSSSIQITGGSGDDTVTIKATASGYGVSETINIDVIDALNSAVTITTSPTTTTRGTAFTFEFSGSASTESVITLNSTDTGDVLMDSSGVVTTVTTDGSGNFSASDWYIEGGFGEDGGNIGVTEEDAVEAVSDYFTISGSSPLVVEQTVTLTQTVEYNKGTLVITTESRVKDDTFFEMSIEAFDSNGVRDTSNNDIVRVLFKDDAGQDVTWYDLGPGSSSTGAEGFIYLDDGIWSYDFCKVTLTESNTGSGTITAETPYPISTISDEVDVGLGGAVFVYTYTPVGVQRSTNFTLTIEVQDKSGNVITDAAPACTLTLTGAHASDSLNKTSIATGEWVDGVWTSTTMQITGGSGSVSGATITITDNALAIDSEATEIGIYATVDTVNASTSVQYVLHGEDDTPISSTDTFNHALADAKTALLGDTASSYDPWSSAYITTTLSAESTIWYYDAQYNSAVASFQIKTGRFHISDAIKNATKVAASVRVRGSGYDYYDRWSRATRDQGKALVYISENTPDNVANMENGTYIGSINCIGTDNYADWDDQPALSIPTTFIDNMTGNYLHLYAIHEDWTLNAQSYAKTYDGEDGLGRHAYVRANIESVIKILY